MERKKYLSSSVLDNYDVNKMECSDDTDKTNNRLEIFDALTRNVFNKLAADIASSKVEPTGKIAVINVAFDTRGLDASKHEHFSYDRDKDQFEYNFESWLIKEDKSFFSVELIYGPY